MMGFTRCRSPYHASVKMHALSMKMCMHIVKMTCHVRKMPSQVLGSHACTRGRKWCMTVLHICGAAIFSGTVLVLMQVSLPGCLPAQILALGQAVSQAVWQPQLLALMQVILQVLLQPQLLALLHAILHTLLLPRQLALVEATTFSGTPPSNGSGGITFTFTMKGQWHNKY